MKKTFVLFLLSLVALLAFSNVEAKPEDKRKEYITRVETCEAILQEFQARQDTAIPQAVLAKAKAIIISNQFKAGLFLGFQEGYGVMMVKRSNGLWSVPALIKTGEASIGLQAGANSVEVIYVITDDQTPRILFNHRMNVGVDAKAVAGPKFADSEKATKAIDAQVLVYSKKAGLYAGATVKSGYINRDDDANRLLYKTNFTLPEILYSDWITPIDEVQPIMRLMQRVAP